MSHTETIKSAIRDIECAKKAASQLGMKYLGKGTHSLFDAKWYGEAFQFDDWCYPVVVVESGECKYDTFGGRWGDTAKLNQFLQGYGVEVARSEAKRLGGDFKLETLPDGSKKCTITVGDDGGSATSKSPSLSKDFTL